MHWASAAVVGEPPSPIYQHTATLVGSKIFVIGGSTLPPSSSSVHSSIEIHALDTETLLWCSLDHTGDVPSQRGAHSASLVGEKIYLFGGGFGKALFGSVHVLDTKTMHWTQPKIQGTSPCARRGHASAVVDSTIYIFGGGDGKTILNDCYALNTEKLKWTCIHGCSDDKKALIPQRRGYGTLAHYSNGLLSIGGSDTKLCFSDISFIDLGSMQWQKKKVPHSQCRFGHTSSVVGDWLFIHGGCDGDNYCGNLQTLNLEKMVWEKPLLTGEEPSPRAYHTMTPHDCRVFIIGGFDGATAFNDVHILELGPYAYLAALTTSTKRH